MGKVVQGNYTGHYRGECDGNLRVIRVRRVLFAIHHVAANFRAKRVPHLAGRATELNDLATRTYINSCESLRRHPVRHRLNVSVSRAEFLAELFGSQPSVIVPRALVLLIVAYW